MPVGSATTGATAIIRANLDLIRKLRADGTRWAAIADALSAQGVHRLVDGERRPLNATRLTALVKAIEQQDERDDARRKSRTMRPDLARPVADIAKISSGNLALALKLQSAPNIARDTEGNFETEEAMRLRRYEAMKQKYTKDQ